MRLATEGIGLKGDREVDVVIMELGHYLHSSYSHATLRAWHSSLTLKDSALIYPVFVTSTPGEKSEISSMPGNYRYGYDMLVEALRPLVDRSGPRLKSIILFGTMEKEAKTEDASSCLQSPVLLALPLLKEAFQNRLILAVDVCLCAYTSHGHCGLLNPDGSINLIPSTERLAEFSVALARAGADVIAPSDMMDGRILYIREALLKANLSRAIMSYSSKFQSCFYGPFRDAADSAPSFGDRAAYQLPPAARDLAIRAAERDIAQGADFVMVKPSLAYMDLIRDIKNTVNVPIACYQVSGEYAMLYHAAKAGAFELKRAVMETMTGYLRAGADIVITYFTPSILDWLAENTD